MTDTGSHTDDKRGIKFFAQVIGCFHHVNTFLAVGRLHHGNLGCFGIIAVILLILGRKHPRLICSYDHIAAVYPHVSPGKHRVCCHIHAHMLHRYYTSQSCNRCSDSRFHGYLFIGCPLCINLFVCRQVLQDLCTWCSRICRCIRNTCLICSPGNGLIAGH